MLPLLQKYQRLLTLSIGLIIVALVSTYIHSDTVTAATGINRQINFQGKVVNSDGTNVADGNYNFEFKLYSVDTAGTAIWTETRTGANQVAVQDGIFRVSLGSVTSLPGSVDFNTDNIYLGVNFNGDGEMSPRIRFTAVPYAFNAEKVAGLTVTNTTGTLTIPAATIAFSGANNVTLTSTGTTTLTLPTTGTLATLAGTETFSNKTIASTGLTVQDNTWIGLGSGAGKIEFDDQARDEINFLTSNVGINTAAPASRLHVYSTQVNTTTTTNEYTAQHSLDATTNVAGNRRYDNSRAYFQHLGNANNTGYSKNLVVDSYNSNTATTTTIYGIYNTLMNSDTGTLQNAYGNYTHVWQLNGTIDTSYGNYINIQGATTGYAVYIQDIVATTGYGMYQAGSDDLNYFAGNVGLGTTTIPRLLTVNGAMRLNTSSAPGSPAAGDIYADGTDVFYHDGSGWVDLTVQGGTTYWSNTLNALHPKDELAGVADLLIGGSSTASANVRLGSSGTGYFAGNVSIGTTTTSEQLNLGGAVTILGSKVLNYDSSTYSLMVGSGVTNVSGAEYNYGFGTTALDSINNIAADYNIGIGYDSLTTLTSGNQNTAVGHTSLRALSNGTHNVSVGNESLYTLTAGVGSAALGYQAGYYINSGNYNVALGYQASKGTASYAGSGNVSLGGFAGWRLGSLSDYNVAIGYNAGLFLAGSSDDNVLVGREAGRGLGTSTNYNVFIGSQAGYGISGSSNVMIGYQAGYSATGSNKLYIENSNSSSPLIYGDFSTDLVTINGNLGVGTTSILQKVTIAGSGAAARIATKDTSTAGLNAQGGFEMYDSANARVGFNVMSTGIYWLGTDVVGGSISLRVNDNDIEGLTIESDGDVVIPTGNLGLGTTTIPRLLTVDGAMRLNTITTPGTPASGDIYSDGTDLFFYNGSGWDDLTGGGASYWGLTANALHPANEYAGVADVLVGGSSTASATIRLASNGQGYFAGNVGIGSTAPTQLLDISKSQNAGTWAFVQNATSGTDATAGFSARNGSKGVSLTYRSAAYTIDPAWADAGGVRTDTSVTGGLILSAGGANDLKFETNDVERMRIDSTGNIGIGTTTIDSKLEILTSSNQDILQLIGDSVTTNDGIDLSADGLTTGYAINAQSTSTALTTGGLLDLDWTPASVATASGDLFRLQLGAHADLTGNLFALYDSGTSLFKVSTQKISSGLPHEFTAAGDVTMAYDLIFTNQTSSTIESYGPLTISSGESYENLDLTLKPSGTGAVVIDDGSNLEMYADQQIIFDVDDGSNSYIQFDNTNNRIEIFADGSERFRFTATGNNESNGTITTTLSDVAENYPTLNEALEPGDVVVLQTQSQEGVAPYLVDTSSNETKDLVVGVVSSKPGLVLGGSSFLSDICSEVVRSQQAENTVREELLRDEYRMMLLQELESTQRASTAATLTEKEIAVLVEQTDLEALKAEVPETTQQTIADRMNSCKAVKQVPIALAGRVPVKFDRSAGDIKPGDLLMVSPTLEGHAVKASGTGWVIGRALEANTRDSETIMMFVSLAWYTGVDTFSGVTSISGDVLGASLASDSVLRLTELNGSQRAVISTSTNILGTLTADSITALDGFSTGMTHFSRNEITTLNGSVLRLQTGYGAGNIEAFNKKIIMTSDGGIIAADTIQATRFAGSDASRGSVFATGTRIPVSQNWDVPPVSITVTPEYQAQVWVSDITKTGFVINTSESNPSKRVFWWAVW